jgi:hypothetical protein
VKLGAGLGAALEIADEVPFALDRRRALPHGLRTVAVAPNGVNEADGI